MEYHHVSMNTRQQSRRKKDAEEQMRVQGLKYKMSFQYRRQRFSQAQTPYDRTPNDDRRGSHEETPTPNIFSVPCTICFEEMIDPRERKNISSLNCGHVFCTECILRWIVHKPACPICNQAIIAKHIKPLYLYT